MKLAKLIQFKTKWEGHKDDINIVKLTNLIESINSKTFIKVFLGFFGINVRWIYLKLKRRLQYSGWERHDVNETVLYKKQRYFLLLQPSTGQLLDLIKNENFKVDKNSVILCVKIDGYHSSLGFDFLSFQNLLVALLTNENKIETSLIVLYYDNVNDFKLYDLNDTSFESVEKSIEFPQEYYQAGLGILSYFGEYLRENYPNQESSKVRIEQEGLTVRLIVENSHLEGREIVEKALNEYELIISGQEPVEKFANNDKVLLDVRNELRIAKARIESQQDIIKMQQASMMDFHETIRLGLKAPSTISLSQSNIQQVEVSITIDIDLAVGQLKELKEELANKPEAVEEVQEVEKSLTKLQNATDKSEVRSSGALSKFKRFLDKSKDSQSTLSKAIELTKNGAAIVKDLMMQYDKIADWCGLPGIS